MLWMIVFLVVAFGASAVMLAGYVFSGVVLHGHRQPIVRTPKEHGMEFEDVEFPSTDGLRIKGWFLPVKGETRKAVVMTHPFPFNRHGFLARNQGFPPLAFTNVDLLTTAKALHFAGYPVLMFDFRSLGESEAGTIGVGLNEYQDVLGAVGYLARRPDLNNPDIGFASFCMGANSTIVALSKGGEIVSNVKALAAIQPVSAAVFVTEYLRAVYTPLSVFLAGVVDWWVQKRGGYPLAEMTPIPYAKGVRIPTLLIQAPKDRWTTQRDTQAIFDAISSDAKELWWVDGIARRFDTYNYIGEHPERLLEFFKRYL